MEEIVYLEKQKILQNRSITIKIKQKIINDTSVLCDYIEKERLRKACEEGCVNFGRKWSCPPFSKSFLHIQQKYEFAYLSCFYTEMKYYSDIKNKYVALKAANSTLKSLIEKCSRIMENNIDGYALLSGSCRLCKTCQCKNNLPCKYPDRMRYSLEATSINVQKLCEDFLNHRLLWYINKKLPEYTSTVALVLFNGDIKAEQLFEAIDMGFSI